MYKRTHSCGELSKQHVGKQVALNGWVNTIRLHGQLVFVDLRDRYGKTQLTFNTDISKDNVEIAKKLSMEDVISITGVVQQRADEAVNPKMATGEIEVEVKKVKILNETKPLPFLITDRESAMEDLRLKYRYLELRTEELQNYLIIRHKAAQAVRKYLSDHRFLEVETPVLMKSTPEGARDYLVPSRIHKGKFYALPQSPQIYKQLLMISGFDRYFQIVKCFRDEDLRADRQPEFTQIDIEMSFVNRNDVVRLSTGLTEYVFKSVIGIKLSDKFPVFSYNDVMERYGTDRPDLRFDLELRDVKAYTDKSGFNAFKSAESVNALVIPGGIKYSRKIIDGYTDYVKKRGAKGLTFIKVEDSVLSGGIAKYFDENLQKEILTGLSLENGDILFLIGDNKKVVLNSLGALRKKIGQEDFLSKDVEFAPLWVIDFPMFEWNEDENRYEAMQHPFTSPRFEDIEGLENSPASARSLQYDLIINGYEVAGGSIRIHHPELQKTIFRLLGISDEEAEQKFGFFVEALKYGTPPHGGIAFGFDRIVMLLARTNQIRDVIAFPKTTSALSLMDGSPGEVAENQLDELGIRLKK